MDFKILLVILMALLIIAIPCVIVQHEAKPAAKPASSADSVTMLIPSGVSHTFSAILPLLSLEPRINGMRSDGLITLKIIDIYHQDNITDWSLVKKSVDGIYMKATEGTTYTDPSYKTFAAKAKAAKIPIGFYHYFWPGKDTKTAVLQADYFYKSIKDIPYDFYPVIDIEETNGQSAKTVCENVKAFCAEFTRVSHQDVMLYCSPAFANRNLGDKNLNSHPLWIANYKVNDPGLTTVWPTFDVWQFGTDISVPGISGHVDGDIATNNIFLDPKSAPKL